MEYFFRWNCEILQCFSVPFCIFFIFSPPFVFLMLSLFLLPILSSLLLSRSLFPSSGSVPLVFSFCPFFYVFPFPLPPSVSCFFLPVLSLLFFPVLSPFPPLSSSLLFLLSWPFSSFYKARECHAVASLGNGRRLFRGRLVGVSFVDV